MCNLQATAAGVVWRLREQLVMLRHACLKYYWIVYS